MLMHILLFGMPGGPELWVILLGVVLMFGGRKIPELMRGLGQGIREFNDAKGKVKQSIEEGMRRPEDTATESK